MGPGNSGSQGTELPGDENDGYLVYNLRQCGLGQLQIPSEYPQYPGAGHGRARQYLERTVQSYRRADNPEF